MENVIDNIICAMARRDEDIEFLQRCRRELLSEYHPGRREVSVGGASEAVVNRFCQDIASYGVQAKPEGAVLSMQV